MSAPNRLAELYDATSGKFVAAGSMARARFNHTATLLPSGKVLVVGGEEGYTGVEPLSSAELYDPASRRFRATGSMAGVRTRPTATLLPNGKVLVAGGDDGGYVLASAELYDPASGRFGRTGSMSTGREGHTATLLDDGKVLVAGGLYSRELISDPVVALSTAELYDPATGQFTPTGSMHSGRYFGVAVKLRDGRVIVAGGADTYDCPVHSAEIYDPASGTFSVLGSQTYPSIGEQAALLADGRVLVAGGYQIDSGRRSGSAEVLDPGTGTFTPTNSMSTARTSCAVVSLRDGRVLVAGGYSPTTILGSAEVYTP